MQSANKAWWRDVKMYRKQRRAVEGRMQEDGGAHVDSVFLLWKRKLVFESGHLGQNYRMGNKGHEAFVQVQKERG